MDQGVREDEVRGVGTCILCMTWGRKYRGVARQGSMQVVRRRQDVWMSRQRSQADHRSVESKLHIC